MDFTRQGNGHRLIRGMNMGKINLHKGCDEFEMFQDYWKLIQENWQVENTEEYWEKVVEDSRIFFEKYKRMEFAKELTMAYLNELERKRKTALQQ